jgi:hypothetical protein
MPSEFDTYPKLLNGIEGLLHRSDLKVDISGWIWLAELELQRVLQVEPTETHTAGLSFTGAQQYVDAPTDFLSARYIEIQTSPKRVIYPASFDRITALRNNVTDGIPREFAVHGGRIELGPIPGSGFTYDIYYNSGLAHLSNAHATGWLLDKGADALLYTALIHAPSWLGMDERVQHWGTLAAAAVEQLKLVAWNEKLGGGPLRIRPDVYV